MVRPILSSTGSDLFPMGFPVALFGLDKLFSMVRPISSSTGSNLFPMGFPVAFLDLRNFGPVLSRDRLFMAAILSRYLARYLAFLAASRARRRARASMILVSSSFSSMSDMVRGMVVVLV